MFFRINPQENPLQELLARPCAHGAYTDPVPGAVQNRHMIDFQLPAADERQSAAAFVRALDGFVVVPRLVAADDSVGQPEILGALHDLNDRIMRFSVRNDRECGAIEIDDSVFQINDNRLVFGNHIGSTGKHDPVESLFSGIPERGIDSFHSGFRMSAIFIYIEFLSVDDILAGKPGNIGGLFGKFCQSHGELNSFPSLRFISAGGLLGHPLRPFLCKHEQRQKQRGQHIEKFHSTHSTTSSVFENSGAIFWRCGTFSP